MYLTSTGLFCPVGFDSESACTAMRAGIAGFSELPYTDSTGEPVLGATASWPGATLGREERMLHMLESAIRQCIVDLEPREIEQMPLFVGLSDRAGPGGCSAPGDRILREVELASGLRFAPQSRVIPGCRTTGFEALQIARDAMRDRGIPSCIISGVDSYIDEPSLRSLEYQGRLKRPFHSDGVIPGEAAAAVRVSALPGAGSPRVIGLGFGTEQATVLTEEPPLLGLGLTGAARSALSDAGLEMHQTNFRSSDVTGESYGFREQALVVGRLLRVHREDGYPLWHASENIGDTGAAAGVVQLVRCVHAAHRGYAPGRVGMCFASADAGPRAVALLALD